ncbi:MAG: M28 family peptidase [Acidobacteriota bacterium]
MAGRRLETPAGLRRYAAVGGLMLAIAWGYPGTAQAQDAASPEEQFEASGRLHDPREVHFGEVWQFTSGGENAEASWSPDGKELIFQSTRAPHPCDQIFRLTLASGEATLVSSGAGRSTRGYYAAGGEGIIYASTHVADSGCPASPDEAQGDEWIVAPSFEIYRANRDGSNAVALTQDPESYNAESAVCPVDGSILFTSDRDGDLELYRMNADGSDVRRITERPGYDGGAFFSQDCSRIVWRASRPREGRELDTYRELLDQHMVRPDTLEIMVANADGSEARQITYLDSGSFAPHFFPGGERVIFSTNYGQQNPRELDLWAVNVDGTGLKRITYAPGFDGFPMFSPDGRHLAFASSRNQGKPGETDVYVARWRWDEGKAPAERFLDDVAWLADDARGGRGLGTPGLEASAVWLADRFSALGLEPAGEEGGYRQGFRATVSVEVAEGTELLVGGESIAPEDFIPASFSGQSEVTAPVIFAGYGISAIDLDYDDYEGLDVEGKVVVVRRFAPETEAFESSTAQARYSGMRYKAFNARERGAVGVLIVDIPQVADGLRLPEEAELPRLRVVRRGDAGVPAMAVRREVIQRLLGERPELGDEGDEVTLKVTLSKEQATTYNVVAKIPAGTKEPLPGALVIGAHYDHLGYGGSGSLAPGANEPHNGADDNASGTAGLLEVSRLLLPQQERLRRDIYLVAFSGEERGLLGSTAFVERSAETLEDNGVYAMLNMDMIGHLRNNVVSVLGEGSAKEWEVLVPPICENLRLGCALSGSGYGASDHTPFYAAQVPVLHFFTGTHDHYHRPSDDVGRINAAGGARISAAVAELASQLSRIDLPLTYRAATPPERGGGDTRSFGASLGTVPDYAALEDDSKSGVTLAGVTPGGAAEKAGMQRGDRLIRVGETEIGDLYDMMFVLRRAQPGDQTTAVVVRDGEELELPITFTVRSGTVR